MATKMTSYNIVELMKGQLEAMIKETLTRDLTDKLVDEFIKTIKPEVKAIVDKVTLDGIEQFRDMAALRDDYKVYIEYKNGE